MFNINIKQKQDDELVFKNISSEFLVKVVNYAVDIHYLALLELQRRRLDTTGRNIKNNDVL